jgi:hypothetical protein
MIDEWIKLAREGFKAVKNHHKYNSACSLADLLSAGFAIFRSKTPLCWLSGVSFPLVARI